MLWTSHLFLRVSLYRTNQFAHALASIKRADVVYWLGTTRIALRQPLKGLLYISESSDMFLESPD